LVSQASQKQAQGSSFTRHLSRAAREGTLFIVGALALYLLIALLTYHPGDPGWSYSGPTGEVRNTGGVAGAWFADIALYLFGYMAFLFPVLIAYGGWLATRRTLPDGGVDWPHLGLRLVGFVVTMAAGSSLARLHFEHPTLAMPLNAGGVLGDVIGGALVGAFSFFGATLFLLALFLTGVTLATGLSWLNLMEQTGRRTLELLAWLRGRLELLRESLAGRRARRDREKVTKAESKKRSKRKPTRIEPVVKKIEPSERVEREKQVPLFKGDGDALPPLALLDGPPPSQGGYTAETLEAMSRQVELKLRDFGIEVEVDAVHPGPVITRFELSLAAGTKVSRITNLAKDLARALSVISVRIVEVIPGKPVIGLEIPNEHRETVVLSEILNSKTFDKAGGPLTLALGKDISGNPFVAELSKMPHLLVAGTTGSGKSVALNALILSLLYKQSPEHVRLIMIDPKMLELSVYDGIGHLLAPVVTDMKEAGNALRWCVAEMERRYRLMASLGVRNIAGYNRKVKEAAAKGQPLPDPRVAAVRGGRRRRVRRPDDGRRQEGRGADRTSGAEGARRRYPPDPGDSASLGRRHHRSDQGQHPVAHRVPGLVAGRFAHHPRPAGRRAAARPGRHALPAAGERHPAPRARRVRRRRRGAQGGAPPAHPRRAGLRRQHHRRQRRGAGTPG
jgi:S-DNA-T family DNA segregation ATPase FtsK/SpoIIIE